jgi:hypothetical protein
VIARPTIPILRCSAAGVPMGFAAEEVAEFHAPEDTTPHLATLLRMIDRRVALGPDEMRERKTLRLRSGLRAAMVAVDGPLTLRALDQGEVLPLPRLLRRGSIAPVIGFTEEEGRVVLLLDVSGIIRMAEGASETDTRTEP